MSCIYMYIKTISSRLDVYYRSKWLMRSRWSLKMVRLWKLLVNCSQHNKKYFFRRSTIGYIHSITDITHTLTLLYIIWTVITGYNILHDFIGVLQDVVHLFNHSNPYVHAMNNGTVTATATVSFFKTFSLDTRIIPEINAIVWVMLINSIIRVYSKEYQKLPW